MILIDTSCWIDYLRRADTAARWETRRLIESDADSVAMCEPIAMELLAGVTQTSSLGLIEQLVNGLVSLEVNPEDDFRAAAAIQRSARATGKTVRSMIDCLIAAVALRHDAEVLHRDADFELIAGVTGLRTRPLL